jgi:P4 family phage/plasmid primase-like protien
MTSYIAKNKNEACMHPELSKFLMKHYVQSIEEFTHSTQVAPIGKFNLSGSHLDSFYELYCRLLSEEGDNFIAGVAEKPKKYMPILVDVDIKLSYDEEEWDEKRASTHIYYEHHITKLIHIYNTIIRYCLQSSKDPLNQLEDRRLTCFVLEKTKPYIDKEKGTIKSGFHLHYPFVYFSKTDQEVHIEPLVLEEIARSHLMDDIGINATEVFDVGMYDKTWLMYGSRKDPKKEFYKLTKIYSNDLRLISLDEVLDDFPILTNEYEELELDPDQSYEYYLPLILSINNWQRKIYKATLPPNARCILRDKLKRAEQFDIQHEKIDMPETLKVCNRLISMLSAERATDYKSWNNVGMCLWSICKGCQEGFDLWVKFSQKTLQNNFDIASCVSGWKRFTPWDWNMGHLRSWAKQDSPQEYEAYRAELQAKRVNDSLNGGQTDLAKYLYEKYGHEFVCADITKNRWFQFKKHKWFETQNGNNLYKLIDCDIIGKFLEEKIKCSNNASAVDKANLHAIRSNTDYQSDDDYKPSEMVDDKTSPEEHANKIRAEYIGKLIAKLKDVSFKDKIIRECRSLFYQEEFLEKLDSNQNLVCFTNGVLDLTTNTFRDGRPDDYCSYSAKYDYHEFNSWDEPAVHEVMSFFDKVFVDTEIRHFFLEYLGTIIKGGQDQLFTVFSGAGANSKSTVLELLHKCLGDYCTTIPTTLLTGKEAQASVARPELMKCRNRKLVYTTEPEQGTEFNCSFIKKITGDGTIDARGLFKENVDFNVTFKLLVLCNNLPRLPPNDDGIWRRIMRVPFLSRFPRDDKEVPEEWPEQVRLRVFKRDPHLQQKIPDMRQAMMWIMFQKYKERTARKQQPSYPEVITNAIEEYRLQNDEYLMYIKECLVKDPSGSITLNEFVEGFTTYCKENYDRCKYKRPDINVELHRRFGDPPQRLRWYGLRLRTVDDDIKEGFVQPDQTNA